MKPYFRYFLPALLVVGVALFSSATRTEPSLSTEALDAYLAAFPGVKNIGIIYSVPDYEDTIQELTAGAQAKNVNVIRFKTPTIKEFPKAVRDMKETVDTAWVLDDPIYQVPEAWSYFVLFAMRNRIKTVVPSEKALAECGLFYFSESREAVVNKRMLQVLGLEVSGSAGPVKYYEPGS